MLLWVGAFDRFMLGQTESRSFVDAMTELLSSFRPDVVHFHHLSRIGLEAVLLVKRLLPAASIVLTLHDYFAICANDGLMTCAGPAARRGDPPRPIVHDVYDPTPATAASRRCRRRGSRCGRCTSRTSSARSTAS